MLLTQANQALELELLRRTAQLEQLMLTDPLTGVGNRRQPNRRLSAEATRAQRYKRPFCAIFVDFFWVSTERPGIEQCSCTLGGIHIYYT